MLCSKLLAGLGAEVIHIEKPGSNIPGGYAAAGKHRLSLNVESSRGRELFKKLTISADVMVESFPPGYLGSLGLSYPDLREVNPRLIMTSITHFGQTGPLKDHKSSDLIDSALGGPMSVCGDPDKPPLKPFGSQAYAVSSLFAANGILLALRLRHTSSQGQYIDISIQECLAASLDHVLVRYFYEGETAGRQGSLYWNKAFRVFACKDGYILLSLSYQWETLVEWLASEGMAEDLPDKRWLDEAERQNNIDHIIEVLGRWTLKHTAGELVELGQLMRFPWGKVASIPEVAGNPQLIERGFFVEQIDAETGKTYLYPGAPVKLNRSPWQVNPDISQPGEYNHRIYCEEMQLTEAEIASLKHDGVI